MENKLKQKEPSADPVGMTGEGQFLIINDTAIDLIKELGDKCEIVELDVGGKDCGQVTQELKGNSYVQRLAGSNKAVLVVNAIAVRNNRDLNSRLGLYLCQSHERYSKEVMSRALGYDDLEETEMTHTDVDLYALTERKHGYLSFVLPSWHLRGVTSIVGSEGFWKKAYRESTLLGCDIGFGYYLVGEGKSMIKRFMEINGRIMRESEYR